jgi:hypothetical protein
MEKTLMLIKRLRIDIDQCASDVCTDKKVRLQRVQEATETLNKIHFLVSRMNKMLTNKEKK